MSERLVVARLFTLERVMCLTRAGNGTGTRTGGVPAVLTIPRGGQPREPRLVLFGDRADGTSRLGAPAFTDAHVVAYCGGRAEADRRELADVLIDRAARFPAGPRVRLHRMLDRYPGCGVAVARGRGGHLAVTRDGPAVAIRGSSGSDEMWAPICGSFLYCWSSAGFAVAELTRAVLLVGRFTARDTGQGCLETTGRVGVTALPAGGRRHAA